MNEIVHHLPKRGYDKVAVAILSSVKTLFLYNTDYDKTRIRQARDSCCA